jgi:hypothetical protein
MPEQYLHTLIPTDASFVPTPEQIVQFLDGVFALGAEPLNWKLLVVKPSGRVRELRNPLTGEVRSMPVNDRISIERLADLRSAIGSPQQYFVSLEGEGPPRTPAFPLYFEDAPFTKTYGFMLRCRLMPEPVSMSRLGDEQTGKEVPFFGQPSSRRDALFRHPVSGELIEVSNAGSARFWVEFEFGKWLLPEINDSLNILNPAIAELAERVFSISFKQGFHSF